eukprot:TRINITY_DN6441_c0_g2_i1.p1 TRINITY_DN6441_c0_g2~~TRINITY_DN6441_c0_g2_i1.p1  ORF type:complete len:737 (-),score=162.18 TRINITY_DN6441_c0_g2_i1:85-2295(-)
MDPISIAGTLNGTGSPPLSSSPNGKTKETPELSAAEKHQHDFRTLFELPPTEVLIEDYSCAMQKDKSMPHGRLYISNHNVYFNSGLFAHVKLKISYTDIVEVQKKNTAILFPNAIEIITKDHQKHFFTSFLYRDKAFQTLTTAMEKLGTTAEVDIANASADSDDEDGNRVENAGGERSDDDAVPADHEQDRSELQFHSFDELVLRKGENGAVSLSNPPSNLTSPVRDAKSRSKSFSEKGSQSVDVTKTKAKESIRKKSATLSALISPTDAEMLRHAKEHHMLGASNPDISSIKNAKEPKNANTSAAAASTVADLSKSIEDSSLIPPHSNSCTHFVDPLKDDHPIVEILHVSTYDLFQQLMSDKSDFWITSINKTFGYFDSTMTPWLVEPTKCCIYRQVNFVSPVTAKIGPRQTKIQQTQRCRFIGDSMDHLVFESFSLSRDVPYGDNFAVVNRFDIVSDPKNPNACIATAVTFVKFFKSVWGMQTIIEKTATSSGKDFCNKYLAAAKERIGLNKVKSDIARSLREEQEVEVGEESAPTEPEISPAIPIVVVAPPIVPAVPVSFLDDVFDRVQRRDPVFIMLILLTLVVGLIVLPFLFSVSGRLNSFERQQIAQRQVTTEMENRLLFLHNFVEVLSANVTGVEGDLKKQWNYWQMNTEVIKQFDHWKSQLQVLNEEIDKSKRFLEYASGKINFSSSPSLEEESGGSWLWLFTLLILGGASGYCLKSGLVTLPWKIFG